MKKTFALLLVASLLLAGCTELVSSDDDETKKIEVNEDIAIEKINDFVTVDEDESFGITVMYEMDSDALEDMGLEVEEDGEDSVLTVEMTEASEAPAPPEPAALPETPVEKAPEQRIDLDLNPSEPAPALQFDQNIQLSP